jgi:hypothetical protein
MAPAPRNYPGSSYAPLAIQHDVFEALIRARQLWRDQLAAVGGRLRTGLYANRVGTRDFVGRWREMAGRLRGNGFVREVFPFRPDVYALLERPDSLFARLGLPPSALTDPVDSLRPKLHAKSQLFATDQALRGVLGLPQWDSVLVAYAAHRASTTAAGRTIDAPLEMNVEMLKPLEPALSARPPAERQGSVVYLTTGSANQDERSRTDNGEVLCVVAGDGGFTALLDFVYLVASGTWVDTVEQLDRLVPPAHGLERWLARWAGPEL